MRLQSMLPGYIALGVSLEVSCHGGEPMGEQKHSQHDQNTKEGKEGLEPYCFLQVYASQFLEDLRSYLLKALYAL